MAGLIDDVVKDLMAEAQKTTSADRDLVKSKVLDTIGDINKQVQIGAILDSADLSIVVGTAVYALPADFGSMVAIGEKDTSGDRIKREWERLTNAEYTQRYAGAESVEAGDVRGWFFTTPSATGLTQIRIVPSAESAHTAKMIYYATLNETNINKLGWKQPLYNGAKRLLALWFGQAALKAEQDYANDLKKLSDRRSQNPMRPLRQRDDVQAYNRLIRSL